MTTLAIIGGGIAGRSFIYALAKKKSPYTRIIHFDSNQFAPTCSVRSTAIVAGRGVSAGHSDLGDLLVESLATFKAHVKEDSPQGIYPITQQTMVTTKLDAFKKRYPDFSVKDGVYNSCEDAYLIDTEQYLGWLTQQSCSLPLESINNFVTTVSPGESTVELITRAGDVFQADQLIMAAGSYNRYWRGLASAKELEASTPVQGSYLEFLGVDFGPSSFSITFDGDNLIYHAHSNKLLIGSTTNSLGHELAPLDELHRIYLCLKNNLKYSLPLLESGRVLVGQREKSFKRKPYLIHEGRVHWLGGFYKNGYSLALHLGQKLVDDLTS